MRLQLNELVCTALRANKEKTWAIGAMWTDKKGVVHSTRYRLDPCGQAPARWGEKGAPAAPEESGFGAALRGHSTGNRAADVREAWKQQQFPPLPQQAA